MLMIYNGSHNSVDKEYEDLLNLKQGQTVFIDSHISIYDLIVYHHIVNTSQSIWFSQQCFKEITLNV